MDPDDMDIEDIDDELNLPGDLVNLSVAAKKELLAYKSTHNERDWEEEILRRIESLGKNKDYLALKRLQDKAEGGAAAVTATPGGKRARSTAAAEGSARKKGRPAAKKGGDDASDSEGDGEYGAATSKRKTSSRKASAAATAKGRKAAAAAKLAESSEEEDDFEDDGDDSSAMGDDDDEEEDDLGGDDDDDDDLFDSDEEEEATNAVRRGASLTGNLVKGGTAAAAEKKAKTAKASKAAAAAKEETSGRRKRLSKYDDSSEEDDDEDDDEGDDSGAEGRRRGRYGLDSKRRGASGRRGSDSEGSDDEGDRRRAANAVDTSGPASVEDIQRVQLRRAFVEKWILEPYFEKVVRKQFARVYVGQSTAHNTPLYRMCEVQGIVPYRKSYKLVAGDAATGKPPIVTDRAMLVSIGPSKITMKLDAISNSRITEAELAKYVQTLAKLKPPMELITKDEAHRRREAVTRALNHRYTNEEIQELVQKRMGHSDYITTEFSTAKERLLNKLDVARSKHDEETALRIERELAKLEAGYEQQKERFQASKAMHFHSLNMRNREANAQSDIQASLKRDVRNDATMDPFRRRETLPSIIWNTSGKLHEVVTDMSKGKDKDKNKDKESEAAADKDTAAEEVDPKARKAEAEAKYYALTRAISDGSSASSSASSSAPTVGAVVSTSRAMAAASQGGAGHFLQKQYELQAAASTQFNFFHDLSLDQIRERVRGRLGLQVDPIEATTAKTAAAPADGEENTSNPIRDKYLAARCGHLPPVDSEERELLRRGLKLSTVKIKENRVAAAAQAGMEQ